VKQAPRRTKSYPNISTATAGFALASKIRDLDQPGDARSDVSAEPVGGYSQHRHGTPETADEDDGDEDEDEDEDEDVTEDDEGKCLISPLMHLLTPVCAPHRSDAFLH
jgi:hypothetical protein